MGPMSTDFEEEWDEEWEDEEWYDDSEGEDQDEETADCPECRKPVDLIANSCPHCGHWFLEEEKTLMARQSRRNAGDWSSLIVVIGFVAMLFILATWILLIFV